MVLAKWETPTAYQHEECGGARQPSMLSLLHSKIAIGQADVKDISVPNALVTFLKTRREIIQMVFFMVAKLTCLTWHC